MALSLQNTVQHTTDRFAKSTQHLLSHFSKSFTGNKRASVDSNEVETELTDEENASRCQINFQRLLHKTLQLVQNPERSMPNPHYPALLTRIKQYHKSLVFEFKLLTDFQQNKDIKNIQLNLFPKYESQLNIIKNWIVATERKKSKHTDGDHKEDIIHDIKEANKQNEKQNYKKDWKLRKRRRVMRFSEKLIKEYEEKKLRNANDSETDKKENEHQLNEREALMKELEDMTTLLKKGVMDLRKTLKKDEDIVTNLDEETYGTLDKVTSLNNRLSNYVQETSGMTCSMCIMMMVVIITWIWGFAAIYFI